MVVLVEKCRFKAKKAQILSICWLFVCLFCVTKTFANGPAPVITVQPTNTTVQIQGTATFQVSVSSGTTITYQWFKSGTNITGATQNSLTLSPVQASDAASYYVQVVNGGGSITSHTAALTVLMPAGILTQPQSQTVATGQDVTMSVTANGTAPITYRWSFNGTPVPGPAGSGTSLSLNNVTTNYSGNYTVVVSNSLGATTSAVATLSVLIPPGITTQPQNQAVLPGNTASFSVVPSGAAPFGYQWKFNGGSLVGATTATLSISNTQPAQAGSYQVVITNSVGSVTSAIATLTFNGPPIITTQPQSQAAANNDNVTFSVSSIGTAPLSYRWSINSVALAGPAGANSTLSFAKVKAANAGNYTVIVSNTLGVATSVVAILTVDARPLITNQPQSQIVTVGQSCTLSVAAMGLGPLTYQWKFNGSTVSGATASSLTLTNFQTNKAGSYSVVVYNDQGSTTSSVATVSVGYPPSITAQPQSLSIGAGQTAAFAVTAGGTAALSYQWNYNGTPLVGQTNVSLQINPAWVTNAGAYYVVITNSQGSITSSVANLTVSPPVMTLSAGAAAQSTNGFTFQLSVPVGCQYVVQSSSDLIHWTSIFTNVATSSTATLTDANATNIVRQYYRVFTP